jgi:tRNA threonylcarbamoyladenosine biosynthesis protein TsaE
MTTTDARTAVTRSDGETEALGAKLASGLGPGARVLLYGELGAGKTAFVRGLAAGLGIDPDEVSSPTFTLVHEYRGGRLVLYHADLYRLERVGTDDLGLDQIGADGVLAVEWPDRLTLELAGAIRVIIDIVDDETRRIVVGEGGATDVDGHSIR